jgi:hypothetical protein
VVAITTNHRWNVRQPFVTEQANLYRSVLRLSDIENTQLVDLLARYQLDIQITPPLQPIPGSFWGGEEAGLIGHQLFVREDTPVHSALHETCHFICMDNVRRQKLNTSAGNYQQEENATCYLQILLADDLPSMGRQRMLVDMDAWGYSFRLGSAQAWFEKDAEDTHNWLFDHGLIDHADHLKYKLR